MKNGFDCDPLIQPFNNLFCFFAIKRTEKEVTTKWQTIINERSGVLHFFFNFSDFCANALICLKRKLCSRRQYYKRKFKPEREKAPYLNCK